MNDKTIRIVGAGLFLGGILLAFFYVYLPLEAAKNRAPEVSLSSKLIFLAPVAVIFGGLMAAFGRRGRDFIQSEHNGKQRLKLAGWGVMALCIAAGVGLNEWLKAALTNLGY